MRRVEVIATERYSQRIIGKGLSGDTGIEVLEFCGVTSSGEIHADSLSGVERLEAVFEVFKSRLSVSDNGGFF